MLPPSTDVEEIERDHDDVRVRIGTTPVLVRWLPRGWPRQVREALDAEPAVNVLAASTMSPGARAAAEAAGVGWLDETAAAAFAVGSVVVRTSSLDAVRRTTAPASWTPATLGVVEAILTGTPATVAAVARRTGLSEGTATNALAFLTAEGFLTADAARGPRSGRQLSQPIDLLETYAEAAIVLRSPVSIEVGVLISDPVEDIAAIGGRWDAAGVPWAATGPLAATVQAPFLTQAHPVEVYVRASSLSELHLAAGSADLAALDGGRLVLRPFPGPATERMRDRVDTTLCCVPWPRTYADLRTVGVRGEDAAEHLREHHLALSDAADG